MTIILSKRETMNLKKLSTICLLGFTLLAQANELNNQEAKKIAIDAIKTVGGTLQHTLKTKVKQEGFASAADFCSLEASSLTQKSIATLPKGVSVKRVTKKPRNEKNLANEMQTKVLEEIETKMKSGTTPKLIIKKITTNHYQVYKPLIISKACLNCHGDNTTRNKDAYTIIAKHYPNDKAINYKLGELRGAFLVDIIK